MYVLKELGAIYDGCSRKHKLRACAHAHTSNEYSDNIFIELQHGKAMFTEFLNNFNIHESFIKFIYCIWMDSVYYLDSIIFKAVYNKVNLLNKICFDYQMLHKLTSVSRCKM